MQPSKATLRAQALVALTTTPTSAAESRAIAERITALHAFRSARGVALYAALPGEPDLSVVWRAAIDKQIVCVAGRRDAPQLRAVAALCEMVRTPRGFYEAPAGPSIDPATVDLWIVPGLQFDSAGVRLGRGAGYYDRVLAVRRRDALALGVVPERWFTADALPREPHDVPVDAIVTESALHRCGGEA